MNLLTQILSSRVRAEIFKLLFVEESPSIHLRDLQRRSGLSIGSIQKEVANLKRLDLLNARRDGNRLYYSANTDHPIFREIYGLVEKTSGFMEDLKSKLLALKGVECAFVFGSFANSREKSHSDVDLIVIGEIGLRPLMAKLKDVMHRSERELNPHVYSRTSWRAKRRKADHFITSVMLEKKIFLVGDDHVLK